MIDIADSLKNLYKRSGLNKLFSSPKMKDGKIVIKNGKKVYKFDFGKMWRTVTSKDGWKNIKKTLKCNWKGVVFGDKGKFTLRWKRAFTSKDTKRIKRVEKVAKMFKYTVSNPVKNLKNINKGLSLLSKKKIELEDIHSIIKNTYSSTGWSGGSATVLDITSVHFDRKDLDKKMKAALGVTTGEVARRVMKAAIENVIKNARFGLRPYMMRERFEMSF